MEFILFLTDRCNLSCRYCGEAEARDGEERDPTFHLDRLVEFLNRTPELGLHLYGGEPLLEIPLLEQLVSRVKTQYATIQTNGLLLDQVSPTALSRLDLISVSIDGDRRLTDSCRGEGVYDRVLAQAQHIRENGYGGEIHARMTVTPGVDIEKAVRHLAHECPFEFDGVHWQLGVLFHTNDAYSESPESVRQWFQESYNPGISRLIDLWIVRMRTEGQVSNWVPFLTLMESLLSKTPVDNVRCGAGWLTWSITACGDVYPCPVMSSYPEFRLGSIETLSPSDLVPTCELEPPCPSCDIFSVCGGRCLCSNLRNLWDDAGFDLVCQSVRHLVTELRRVQPTVQELIDAEIIDLDDFDRLAFHEIIP